jgi:hypothetical protein
MLPDDRDGLGGTDVVTGTPVFITGDGVEVLLNDLLAARESIAATHGEMTASLGLHGFDKFIESTIQWPRNPAVFVD